MYKTVQEAVFYAKEFRSLVKGVTGVEIVLAPPFTAIHAVADALHASNVAVGGQDVFWEREGAFTGEVGAHMLAEAGAEYVIVGHSERRTHFGETNAIVNRKLQAAVAAGLTPIVCVGETLQQRDAGETLAVLDRQVKESLDGVTGAQLASLALAYEPVWAIGTGRNATPEQAAEAQGHIRQRLRQWFGVEPAGTCHILYGGSVKADNIGSLIALEDVDGALVGGASLDVRGFADIVRKCTR
jgi:triosephosphate isomerase